MTTITDDQFMNLCLQLAAKGGPLVKSNPMVGCVIVNEGKIIGKGFHQKYGGPHAEVNAIESVKNKKLLSQSTLFVNLEPCCHQGKTPPCTDLIIKNKIKKVVIGSTDPNPKVAGKGINQLNKAGIEVDKDVLVEECNFFNRRFFVNQLLKRPYIVLKWAETKDGFFARNDFKRKQISNSKSQKFVHGLRSAYQNILVGYRTVQFDNPELTVRKVKAPQINYRIIIDEFLDLPLDKNVFDGQVNTIVFNTKKNKQHSNFIAVKLRGGNFFMKDLINYLQTKNFSSILVEGGVNTLQKFIDLNLWDETIQIISPHEWKKGIKGPQINRKPDSAEKLGNDSIFTYFNSL